MQMPGGHLPDTGLTVSAPYVSAKRKRQSSPVTGSAVRQERGPQGLSFLVPMRKGLEPISMPMPGGHRLAAGLTAATQYEAQLRQSSPVTGLAAQQERGPEGLSFLA